MAVVGDAYVVVHAITRGVPNDIRQGFRDADRIGNDAGNRVGRSFQQGFRRGGGGGGLFGRQFQTDARNTFRSLSRLITVGYVLGPAFAGAAAALSAVGSGLVAMASQAAAAGPALLGLLGVFSALIQGAIALKLAFMGVGAAISAGLNAGGGGGGGGGSAEAAEAAAKRVEDARRRLADAIENAAEVEERAARTVADAWSDYQEAIEETTDAVDRLKDAQREAAEMTQQLGFDVEEAALATERSGMRLEQARAQLAAASDLPVDSAARREAELAFREAELEYRRTLDRSNDLRQEQEEAAEAGSAGAELLADASRDVADAKQREADAFRDYQDAVVEAERARRDAQRAIIEAEEELADALEDLKKGFGGAGGGADAFAAAMAKLSPEAQAFVRYIISIQDELKKLQFAAGRKLFPQLTSAIDNLVKNLFPRLEPLLEGTGDALGKVAIQISKTITTADNLGNIERIWKANDKVIGSLGGTISNLLNILLDLLDAARPLTKEFAEWTNTLTGGWAATLQLNKDSGALSDTMAYAGDVARQLGRIFGNLFDAFMDIGKAASGPGSGGEMILNALEGATEKFKAFVRAISENGELEQFFRDSASNFISIGRAVTKIAKGFIDLGNNQGVANFFDTISQDGGAIDSFFSAFEKMADSKVGTLMGELANNIARVFDALTETGSLQIFFDILNRAAKALADFVSNETVAKIIGVAAAFFAITRALRVLSFFATGAFKFVFGGISLFVGAIKGAMGMVIRFAGLLTGMAPAAVGGFGNAISIIAASVGLATGPFIAIVAAIGAVIAILIGAYTQSEIFRESIGNLVSAIGGAFMDAVSMIGDAFSDAFSFLGGGEGGGSPLDGLLNILKMIGDVLGNYVVPIIQGVFVGAIRTIGTVISWVVRLVGGALGTWIGFFQGLYEGIRPYIDQIIALWEENFKPALDSVTGWLEGTVLPVFNSVFGGIGDAITAFWTFVQPIVQAVGNFIGQVLGTVIVGAFKVVIGIVKVLGAVMGWLWTTIVQPVFNFIVGYITNFLVPAYSLIWQGFQAVIDFLRPVFDLFVGLFNLAVGIIRTAIGVIVAVFSLVWKGFQVAWNLFKGVWTAIAVPIINTIKSVITSTMSAVGGLWNKYIKEPFLTAWNAVKGFWDNTIWPFLSGLGSKVSGMASSLWSGLSNGLSAVVGTIKSILNGLISGWNALIDKINSIPGVPDIPTLPSLAYGGIVRPRAGGTIVRVAEAGQAERVEPLDPNGLSARDKAMINYMSAKAGVRSGPGGGVTVNVYPSAGMDERQLAARVSRAIAQQMRKGAA
jgi:phage-related protein